jgi:hypothetical protein
LSQSCRCPSHGSSSNFLMPRQAISTSNCQEWSLPFAYFLSLHSCCLFRPIKAKNMHSVCMLYTSTRSCK